MWIRSLDQVQVESAIKQISKHILDLDIEITYSFLIRYVIQYDYIKLR